MIENRNASAQFKNIFRDFIYRCTNFWTGRKVFFQKKEFLEVPYKETTNSC